MILIKKILNCEEDYTNYIVRRRRAKIMAFINKNLPKQFLKLPFNSKYNLFEQTILGLKKSKVFDKPIILCSEKHKFLILESLEKLKISFEDIIVEKLPKNTASSVLLGVLFCMREKSLNIL